MSRLICVDIEEPGWDLERVAAELSRLPGMDVSIGKSPPLPPHLAERFGRRELPPFVIVREGESGKSVSLNLSARETSAIRFALWTDVLRDRVALLMRIIAFLVTDTVAWVHVGEQPSKISGFDFIQLMKEDPDWYAKYNPDLLLGPPFQRSAPE